MRAALTFLACTLLLASGAAHASDGRQEQRGPSRLWKEFPLDPARAAKRPPALRPQARSEPRRAAPPPAVARGHSGGGLPPTLLLLLFALVPPAAAVWYYARRLPRPRPTIRYRE